LDFEVGIEVFAHHRSGRFFHLLGRRRALDVEHQGLADAVEVGVVEPDGAVLALCGRDLQRRFDEGRGDREAERFLDVADLQRGFAGAQRNDGAACWSSRRARAPCRPSGSR
jgi:hypothetical protein